MQSRISSPAGGPALSEFHELRQPLAVSAAFHIGIILIALFGLDLLPKKKMEIPIPISVTMAKPSDIARSNHEVEPAEKPSEQPPQQSRAPEQAKPAQSTPPPPVAEKVETPPPPPEKLAPPPPPKPPEKPTPPIDKLQPVQQAQPQFQQPAKLPALQRPAQVAPKPPLPTQKPAKQADPFDDMMKNLVPVEKADQISKQKPIKAAQQAGSHAEKSDQLTADEMEAVRQRLKECWAIPAGIQGGEDIVVNIAADFNPDMTLKSESLVDTNDVYNRDPAYRAAADSAMRALRMPLCNPLPLPPGRLGSMTLTFNPNKF